LKMDEDYLIKDVLTPETVYEPPIALPMFSNRPKYIPWGLLDFDHIPKSNLKTKTYYGRRRIINPWGFPEIRCQLHQHPTSMFCPSRFKLILQAYGKDYKAYKLGITSD